MNKRSKQVRKNTIKKKILLLNYWDSLNYWFVDNHEWNEKNESKKEKKNRNQVTMKKVTKKVSKNILNEDAQCIFIE